MVPGSVQGQGPIQRPVQSLPVGCVGGRERMPISMDVLIYLSFFLWPTDCLQGVCLVFKCSGFSRYLIFSDFQFNFIMVGEHSRKKKCCLILKGLIYDIFVWYDDFNPFKSIKTYFITQKMICFGECIIYTSKIMFSVTVRCHSVLSMSDRSRWLIVFFRSSVFLIIF